MLVLGASGSRAAISSRVRDGATVERAGQRIIERRKEENTEATFRVLGADGFRTDPSLEEELQKEDREMHAAQQLARVSNADVDSAEILAARRVLGL